MGSEMCIRDREYTYLYAFGTIADEADDMQDVFYNICDQLELVD